MKLSVYNIKGEDTERNHVKRPVFGIEPNEHIYLDVKQYLANQRQRAQS